MDELRSGFVEAGYVEHDGDAQCPVAADDVVDVLFGGKRQPTRRLVASEVDWTTVYGYRVSIRPIDLK